MLQLHHICLNPYGIFHYSLYAKVYESRLRDFVIKFWQHCSSHRPPSTFVLSFPHVISQSVFTDRFELARAARRWQRLRSDRAAGLGASVSKQMGLGEVQGWLATTLETLYSSVVTICTASLTFNNSTFCPHTVFLCFVWISEQTAIISLYNINWLVFITETGSVYCSVRTGCLTVIQVNYCTSVCQSDKNPPIYGGPQTLLTPTDVSSSM